MHARKIGSPRVIATMVLAFTAAIGTVGVGNAQAFPILNAVQDQIAHHCNVIGSADGYQAVVCADIDTNVDSLADGQTQWNFWGAVEAYCQQEQSGVWQPVTCANMTLQGSVNTGIGDTSSTMDYKCGHANGTCPALRIAIATSSSYSGFGCNDTNTDALNQAWTIAQGSATSIELPVSDKTFYADDGQANDGVNESSGHYFICALIST
jgi:hypothetical protein